MKLEYIALAIIVCIAYCIWLLVDVYQGLETIGVL